MVHVGIVQKDHCIIGIIDEEHKVPCADHLDLVYINLYSTNSNILNFIVAGRDELIIRNVKEWKTK